MIEFGGFKNVRLDPAHCFCHFAFRQAFGHCILSHSRERILRLLLLRMQIAFSKWTAIS
jgi:hypothetical protein